jgi:alcohol dehydrogenase
VLAFNRSAIEERMGRLAAFAGIAPASFDGFLAWILELRETLGVPHRLDGLGVGDDRIEQIAAMAERDPSAGGNPLPFDAAAARQVLEAAVAGRV